MVFVSLDPCQYGVKEPVSEDEDLYRKERIAFTAIYPDLAIVKIQCARRPEDREHEHV